MENTQFNQEQALGIYDVNQVIVETLPERLNEMLVDPTVDFTRPTFELVEVEYIRNLSLLKTNLERFTEKVYDPVVNELPVEDQKEYYDTINQELLTVSKKFLNDLVMHIDTTKELFNLKTPIEVPDVVLNKYEHMVIDHLSDLEEARIEETEELNVTLQERFDQGFDTWWQKVQDDPKKMYYEIYHHKQVTEPVETFKEETQVLLKNEERNLLATFNEWVYNEVITKQVERDFLSLTNYTEDRLRSLEHLIHMNLKSSISTLRTQQQLDEIKNLVAQNGLINAVPQEEEQVYYEEPHLEDVFVETDEMIVDEYDQDTEDLYYEDDVEEEVEATLDTMEDLEEEALDDDLSLDDLSLDDLDDDDLSLDDLALDELDNDLDIDSDDDLDVEEDIVDDETPDEFDDIAIPDFDEIPDDFDDDVDIDLDDLKFD